MIPPFAPTALVSLLLAAPALAGLSITKVSAPPSGSGVLISQTTQDTGGRTSVRYYETRVGAPDKTDTIVFAPQIAKYYFRDRDLGQTFTTGSAGFFLDAITLRVGPADSPDGSGLAVEEGALGAAVSLQIYKITGTPTIHNNGSPPKSTTQWETFGPTFLSSDDYMSGESYELVRVVRGGVLPQAFAKNDYLRWNLTGADEVYLQANTIYAFVVCFDEPGVRRNFTLANRNRAANPGATDPYPGGHGIRREGATFHIPDVFIADENDPADVEAGRVASMFTGDPDVRASVHPTTIGYPDVCTFRDLVFYIEGTPGSPPPASGAMSGIRPLHPRLLWTPEGQEQTVAWAAGDPLLAQLIGVVTQYAEAGLTEPVFSRVVEDAEGRIKDQRRAAMFRVFNCAMAYRLTGDLRYARRVRDDLLSGSGVTLAGWKAANPGFVEATSWAGHQQFTDWGPGHFLNVGEISALMAVGFDWIYDALTSAERVQIRNGITAMGINPYLARYDANEWWRGDNNNWNQVCNAGPLLAALAVAEGDYAKAEAVRSRAVASITNSMESFKPDGAWPEGPTYWAYGATYNAFLLSGLRTALGDVFGLDADDGYAPFGRSGAFHIQTVGPDNAYFSFGDAKQIAYFSPVLFFLSHEFSNPVYAFYERGLVQKDLPRLLAGQAMQSDTLDRFLALLVAWYNPAGESLTYEDLPLDQAFRGDSANAAMRASWTEPGAAYVAFKGGRIKADHGHMDVGTFVLDALGVRWAEDLGGDNYALPGYFDFASQRWTYYRLNNRGHNTLTIHNALQNPDADIPVAKFYSAPELAYSTLDMSPAYSGQAASVRRGFAMLDRRRVLVEDEIVGAPAGQTIRWGMITKADIALAGGTATLTRATGAAGPPVITVLSAVADAHIRNGTHADFNYGGRTTVDLSSSLAVANHARKGYFRFNLSGLPQPKANVVAATFRLKSADVAEATDNSQRIFELWALNDAVNHAGRLGEDWTEGTASGAAQAGALTWNNAPGHDSAGAGMLAAHATDLGMVSANPAPALNSFVSWTGSTGSPLASSIAGDTNGLLTFVVRRGETNGPDAVEDFYAKEHASADAVPAQLIVTQQAPGPAVALLAEILEPPGATFTVLSTAPSSPPGQNQNAGTSMLAVQVPAATGTTRIVVLLTPQDGGPALPAPAFRPLASGNPGVPVFDVAASVPSIAERGATEATFNIRRTGDMLVAATVPYTFGGSATPGSDYTVSGPASPLDFPTNGATSRKVRIAAVPDDLIEGDEAAVLTLVSGSGYALGSAQASVAVLDRPGDAWRALKFSGDFSLAAWDLDPDGDGLDNLAEYALGREPLAADGTPATVTDTEEVGGIVHLVMRYVRPYPAPLDILYAPKVSGGLLQTWCGGPGHILETPGAPSGGIQGIEARDLTPAGSGPRFLKLDILLEP